MDDFKKKEENALRYVGEFIHRSYYSSQMNILNLHCIRYENALNIQIIELISCSLTKLRELFPP